MPDKILDSSTQKQLIDEVQKMMDDNYNDAEIGKFISLYKQKFGTDKQSQSMLYKPSETPEQKQQRYDKVKNNDAVSLATNYDTESNKPLDAKYVNGNFVGIDIESRNQYKQSREGKTGEIVSGYLNRGDIKKEDLKYLNQVAPLATAQIVASVIPKVAEKGKADDADIEAFSVTFPKVKKDAILKQTDEYYKKINEESLSVLIPEMFDTAKITDTAYLQKFRDGIQNKQAAEIVDLQNKFPLMQGAPTAAPGFVPSMQLGRGKEYEATLSEINKKYDKLFDSLGRAAASNLAVRGSDELQVGLEYLKYKDPGTYKNRIIAESSYDDRRLAEIGAQLKFAKAKDLQSVEEIKFNQDKLDERFPDLLIAETYHRLGAELYKDDNWFLNFNESIESKDKAAEQLPKKYRDVYFNYIKEREMKMLGSDIPKSGAINQILQGAVSTATATGYGIADITGMRSKKDVIKDMLDSPYKTRYQNVGEMSQSQSRLKELNDKLKNETLTVDELNEKADLETFTNVRGTFQKVVDGSFNLAGQVLFQAIGTKGLGGLTGAGLKSVGLLRTANLASKLGTADLIAEGALDFGIGMESVYNAAGFAVAYASSYDDALQQAARIYPEDEGKQATFAKIVATLNGATERIFKDEKVFDAFKRSVAPNIANLVNKLATGDIKKELLQSSMKALVKDGLRIVGQAGIENTKETIEEVATSVGTSLTKLYLSPTKFNENEAFEDAKNTATTMFTDGGLVALFAGVKGFRANKIGISVLSELGKNKQFTADVKGVINEQLLSGKITQSEADEKMKVVNTIAQTNAIDMPTVIEDNKLNTRQSNKYSIALSFEKLLKDKINATTDSALIAKYQDDVYNSEQLRKKILNKEVFVDDNYEVLTPEEAKAKEEAKAPADTKLTMPTDEQMYRDVAAGNVTTKEYSTQEEIPDSLKNRISSISEVNGKQVIRVTIPNSLNNYLTQQENATTTSQGQEQKSSTTGDSSQRQGTQGEQDQTTTEASLGDSDIEGEGQGISVKNLVGRVVTWNGFTGTLFQEGQTLSIETTDGKIIREVGNVDELSKKSPEEIGMVSKESLAVVTDSGFSINGEQLFNNNENLTDAISIDKNGKIMNVVLKTKGGKRRKFKGPLAEDLAYQIILQRNDNDQKKREALEQYLRDKFQAELNAAESKLRAEQDAAKQKSESDAGQTETTTEEETTGDNVGVPKTGEGSKVVPAFGVITSENLDELDNIKGNKLQKKVLNDVKNVVKAINKIIKATTGKTLQVHIHNQESFTDAVLEMGGTRQDSTSRGFYLSSDGTIHLNMDTVKSDTMLHEGFHPILDLFEDVYPNFIEDVFNQLSSIPEAAGIIANARELYSGNVTQMKEAITDFVAGVADGRIIITPTNFQKIKAFISNLLKSIGIGEGKLLVKNIENAQQLIDLANAVTFTFREGRTDTFEQALSDYEDASGNRMSVRQAQFALNNDFSDVNTKTTFSYLQNQADFDKLKADGFITEDKTLDDFVGKKMIVHRPDAAFTGTISKNGQLLVEGNGGVFYPVRFHEDGYFWASTDAAAVKMAKMLNEMLKENGGVIYMALVSSPSDKLLSSTTASNAVMDFFSSVAMDNLLGLDKKTIAKAIINAATKTALKKIVVTNKDGTEKIDPVTDEPVYRLKTVGLRADFKQILKTKNIVNRFKKSPLKEITSENLSLEEVKKIVREKLANDKSAFPDRKLFSKTLIEEVVKQIKGTEAEQALGKFFNEGQFNDSYKQTKKISKGYDLSGTNVVQSLAEMFTEPMLKGMASKQAYAVLEIKGEVAPVKSDKHESYGMAIESKEKNKTTVHILKERELWTDRFEDPETGESIKGKRESKVLPPTNGITPKAVRVLPKRGAQLQRSEPKTKLGKDYFNAIEKAKTDSPAKFWSVDRPFQDDNGNIDGDKLDKAVKEGRVVRTEAGFGVVDNGDIKGVFKADLTSSEKTGDKVIQAAIKKGGVKLDNFALPNLMKIYERNGFRETSRLPFNKEYAPEGWSEQEGTPDVVAMVYDPNKKLDIEKKEFTDYDEAMKYRDSFLPQFQRASNKKQFNRTGPQAMSNNIKVAGQDMSFVLDYLTTPENFLSRINPKKTGNMFSDFNRDVRTPILNQIKGDLNFWEETLDKRKSKIINKDGDISQVASNLVKKAEDRIDALSTALDMWENNAFSMSDILVNNSQPQFQRGTPTKKLGLNTKSNWLNRFSNKVERARQNLFTVSGVLGKTVKTLQEKMAGNLAAEINKAERLGGKTKKLIEKYKNVITAQQVTDYLTGVPAQPGTPQMPQSLAMALDEMREHIDGLTEQLITLGVIDSPETIALYRENKGKYMLRSYELFNAPTGLLDKFNKNKSPEIDIDNAISKLKNVDQAVIDNALMYLANQEMPRIQTENPTLSLAEQFKLAKEAAKTLANEILGRDEVGYSTKSVAGSVNVKSISERQDIAPEIRALMGEYTDPLYNYYSTIFKIASLTSSRNYLNKLKEVGYNKFLFDKNSPNRPTGSNARIAADESEFLRPLNGLYTFPEMADALKMADAESQNMYRQLAGRVRKYKTVYNPATHVVNVIGNAGFAMSNGHWNELSETYDALSGYLSGSDSPKIVKLIDTLNREGVLGNSVGVNELKQYFDKNKSLDDLLKVTYGAASKVEKVAKGLTKARMAVEKAYQIEDDVFKILAFVNESNRYAKAFYSKKYMDLNPTQMADISDKAGEIVKNTYPTWSRVPKFVKGLSKELFLGNFLSFPAESIRTSYNTLELAMKELASGNGKLRAVGFTRLVGTLAYNGIFTALNYYGFSLAGAGITGLIGAFSDDDEERKKKKQIMQQVAPWNQESADLYVSSFKDGKLVYYDIGRLNSFKYQSDVSGTFFSNMGNKEGAIKSLYRTVAKALEPVFDVDLTYDALIAMKNNEVEETGQKIYNPEEGDGEFGKSTNRAIQYGKFMMKKFGPGVVTNTMKLYDYYGKDSDKFKDELVSTFGPRKYTVDLAQNFYFNLKGPSRTVGNTTVGFSERLEDAKKLYNRYDKSLSEGEQEVNYQKAVAAYKEVLADAREYYLGAVSGGTPTKELKKKLLISKIGGTNNRVVLGAIISNRDMTLNDNAYIRR